MRHTPTLTVISTVKFNWALTETYVCSYCCILYGSDQNVHFHPLQQPFLKLRATLVYGLMRRAINLIHTSELKMLLNLIIFYLFK